MAAIDPKEKLPSDTDEYLGKIIELFEGLLVRKLRASHLIIYIHIAEVKKVTPQIHTLENHQDYDGAARKLLEAIRKGTEPGKWRMFVDALQAVGCKELYDILMEEGEKMEENQWLDESVNLELIDLFKGAIIEHLNLGALLGKMMQEGLITKEDMKSLSAMVREPEKKWFAMTIFFLILHRLKPKNWYKCFLKVLYEDEHHRELVKEIDAEEYSKLDKSCGAGGDTACPSTGESLEADSRVTGDFTASAKNGRSNLTSLQQDNISDTDSTSACPAPKRESQHPSGEGSPPTDLTVGRSCACGCCERMLAEVTSFRSEILEMKDLLHKVLNMNTAGQ